MAQALKHITGPVEAVDAGLAGSVFDDVDLSRARFRNVNLSGATFRDVDFSGVSIEDARIDGMTILGIPVGELLEAYRRTNSKNG